MKSILFLLLPFILFGCASRIITFNYNGFVIDQDNAQIKSFDGNEYLGFKPSTKDIKDAESIISLFIEEVNYSIFYKYKKYQRQYVGLTQGDDKIIFVNFYMDDKFFNFYNKYRDLVNVDDGGDDYFEIKVKLETEEVFDFYVNGES